MKFIVAKNPLASARLPYLLRVPVQGEESVVLASGDSWPRSRDVFCMQVPEWPDRTEIVEEVDAVGCWRAGKAVHLVLDRPRLRRSMFVWTTARGRPAIFWRSASSMTGARPGVRAPAARGLERAALTVAVDSAERYPWRFVGHPVACSRRRLPVGDYAIVRGDVCVAVVERKRVADLSTGAVAGTLGLNVMELSRVPRAAVVVEGRLSDLIKAGGTGGVRPGWILNLLASLQAAYPTVTWMFAETRSLAEDWAYRWLAACSALPGLGAGSSGPRVRDATGRRADLLGSAAAGEVVTVLEHAARAGISIGKARAELNSLVQEGKLEARRIGRRLAYGSRSSAEPGTTRTGTKGLADAKVTP